MGTITTEYQAQLSPLLPPRWVQLLSKGTGGVYVSQGPSDGISGTAIFAGTVPNDTYTLKTGPSPNGPWTTEDSNYVVASNPVNWFSVTSQPPFSDQAATGYQVNTEPTTVSNFPAGASTYTHTGDTTFVDVDATNLIATVVVPPSGRLFVELSAAAFVSAGIQRWGLADANGNLTESQQVIAQDAVKKHYTGQMVITKDSSGVALVPGATVTIKWRFQVDNGANTATIAYGGAGTATPDGPAVMRITPMSNRLTVRPFTTALTALTTLVGSPTDMWVDQKTLVGYSGDFNEHIALSTDQGATWTQPLIASDARNGGVGSVKFLYDGEIMYINGASAGNNPGRLFRSSGWKTNPATATLTQVLAAQGGNGTDAYFDRGFGWSSYGKIIVVSEYGPKAGQNDMARYAFLSTDGGFTFTRIFDLYAQLVALGDSTTGAHMHSAVYDPWWDAIWITHGDTGGGGPTPRVFVSFDHGATWSVAYAKHQFTSVIALPGCILFGSDGGTTSIDGGPNGIYRIPRGSQDLAGLSMQLAQAVGAAGNPSLYGAGFRRYPLMPDAPAFLCFSATAISSDQLWVTYDGFSFKQIFLDVGQTVNGIASALGPMANGLYKGEWVDGFTRKVLTVTPG